MSNGQPQGNDIENLERTGVGAQTVGYDDGIRKTYRTNQIVIKDLNTGSLVVKAKSRNSDVFEDVAGGTIDLSTARTLTITSDSMIEAFELTVTPNAPYAVSVFQSDNRGTSLKNGK